VNFYYRYQLEENHEDFAKQFLRYAELTIGAAHKTVSNPIQKLDALFYLGTAKIYLAAYHGWQSEWLSAYWNGKEGIDYLATVISLDSTYYDAYLGVGLYHYYTDIVPRIAKVVTFILGIDNDRKRGLAELHLASENGRHSSTEAKLFLGTTYLFIEKDYKKSLNFFEELVLKYPRNESFVMLLGENYQKLGKHNDAEAVLSQIVNRKNGSRYPVLTISSHFRLGNLFFSKRDLPSAIKQYQKSLEIANKYRA